MVYALSVSRPHISWFIATACLGFIFGIALALVVPRWFSAFGWVLMAIVLFVLSMWWRRRWALLGALSAGLLLGVWHGVGLRGELLLYKPLYGRIVALHGVVGEDVEKGNSGESRIKLKHISVAGTALAGEVWISASTPVSIKRSDSITVKGVMRPGFAQYASSMSFAEVQKVDRPEAGDVARDLRDGFGEVVRQYVDEPMASLGLGYLTGQQSALPPDLAEQLKTVGLTHIVVASGYNLTILVRFSRRLLHRVSKFSATMASVCLIVGFVLVTGLSPSMSRAALVAGLSLAIWYYGRGIHPFVLLTIAAAITVAIDPLFLWGDLGWYLSFLSFFAVIVLAPLVQAAFWGKKKPGLVRQILVDTGCAQLVTMPLIAFAFGQYATYALAANLLILPLIPLAMALVFLVGIGGLFLKVVAIVVAWPTQWLLGYMVMVAATIAEWPGATGEVSFDLLWLVISYVLIMALVGVLWRRTKLDFRATNLVE